jgi:phosphoribosylanthranilate isomerase
MAVKIKICGLTRAADAARSAAAGASYLGVVFAGGPRMVTPAGAAEVVRGGGGLPALGVFGDQPVEEILQICEQAGLSGAQLHGSYSPSVAARLRATGLLVWRVVRIATPSDLDALGDAIAESDAVLVEPRVSHARGGPGIPLDLAVAQEARRRLTGHPMVLAGGLTPESVAEAAALVRPEIVDVSSGIERQPGVKDPERLARFVEAVFADSPIT